VAPIEMKAELVNEALLALQQGQNDITRNHTPAGGKRHIWMISSHTHQYGTASDIFLRNSDDSKGAQISEGFYNNDYTFNQGFYDWEHPAVRYFEPLKEMENGLVFQTKWNVTGPCTAQPPFNLFACVTFGLTTDDEMMLMTYMYTDEELSTGTGNANVLENNFKVYPNPYEKTTFVNYTLDKESVVKIEVFDYLGKKVSDLVDEKV